MITIISRWEKTQIPPEIEWLMWGQLKNFGIKRFIFVPIVEEMKRINVEQYNTMEEALSKVSTKNRVFLEPTGTKGMYDLPAANEDVTFILGSTSTSNVKYAKKDELYRINEPRMTDMHPTNAAAVALAFWFGQ